MSGSTSPMPTIDALQHLGLFGIRGFLDAETCSNICAELRDGQMKPATVLSGDNTFVVDPQVRSTKFQSVSPTLASGVESRLAALKPRLEQHFDLTLEECRRPDFLVYEEGDFYKPHRDNSSTPGVETPTHRRKVSVVVFLNGETDTDQPGSYGGGALTFYGLIDDPLLKTRGLPLISETGLLIAFPPSVVHEVRPVTRGLRYTVVTWFY